MPDEKPKLRFFYFDAKGTGEPLRLLMHHAQLPFEDVRLDRDLFTKKKSGAFSHLEVPSLVVDGTNVLISATAIARYIGRTSGLYPDDPLQGAAVDALIEQAEDMAMGLTVLEEKADRGFDCLGEPENEESAHAVIIKTINDYILPRHLANFESRIAKARGEWIAHTAEPTIADFIIVSRLEWVTTLKGINKNVLKKYPCIDAYIKRFYQIPSVIAYYAQPGRRK
uniref:GST N-terminal domain-containing protein n=1 Tax=Chromera velia CCMP2878 TaxID=1169474 RepID=A0A0G4FXK7_9ALVE|mmetsp:Transcript_52339/g.102452  ORF Transcript_52339/g.102452 Transcript_52339/m.102452 type:complete len:225 (-) Transcript_52339:124-798(-)|eukprot:Cvel_19247.t1-p1 / transcript=Cvel_19247.t1 / gene=Cvel_19247 / organism=Chromera_velia_CCMP2878 / gene_product=Glutathione S-transferase, putative / transcript_product=Glutathione S-transferase, putative / location=Cvel_scaffold1646:23083-25223(-) / protein_length=224 / sequence_SO=supercontig / SO=protein_coding / is_pseudo=false